MAIKRTLEERIARIEAVLHITDDDTERNAANIDYVAMMTDVELPEEEGDEDEAFEEV